MRGKELLDKLEGIDPAFIEAADAPAPKKPRAWLKWTAAAACLALAVLAVFVLRTPEAAPQNPQQWSENMAAADYFRFCEPEDGAQVTQSEAMLPDDGLERRDFSDQRAALEAAGVIPVIDDHPETAFTAKYNEDGSLQYIDLWWMRRDEQGLENYSDLRVLSGPEPVEIIEDCILIELDEDGNVIEPTVTVTERDGVSIVAEGHDGIEKTLTFQTEHGWYQISGSWNDDFEPVVALLDWFWEHPIDYSAFAMENGTQIP